MAEDGMASATAFSVSTAVFVRSITLLIYLLAVLFATAQPSHAHTQIEIAGSTIAAASADAPDPCETGQPHDHGSCVHAVGHSLSGVLAINLPLDPNRALLAFPADSASLRGATTLPPLRPPTPVFAA